MKYLLIFLLVSCLGNKKQTPSIEESISMAGEYLESQIQDDGKFIYWRHPKKDLGNKYNILRHVGSLYALKMYEDFKPGSIDKNKFKKSLLYIYKETVSPLEDNLLGVWSREKLSGKKNQEPQIKLGAVGLMLVALAASFELVNNQISLEQLEQLGDFLIFMQKSNGSFYSKYYQKTGRDDSWTSLFYPGEAAFGLVELYKLSKKEKYREAALKALLFLSDERKDYRISKMPTDHWALIATEKIIKISPSLKKETRDKLLDHADKVIRKIFTTQVLEHENADVIGSYSRKGKPTPTATRVEGLTAIYPYIRDKELKQKALESIKMAANFLLKSQILDGKLKGSWPRSTVKLEGKGKDVKNHNERRQEVRIDYVQHALSALIKTKINF